MKNQPILLSGIQPSGTLHIGNYLGAIKQWVDVQDTYKEYITIVDLHAITVPQDPKELSARTLEVAAILLASGIDPEKTTLFIQSHVPAHAELGWILNTLTPVGELERMTQYKEKQEKAGVLAGLLNYPTLMAADILLYQPDIVPVGEDQLQHLELTRTLARKFNSKFGETFKEPKALMAEGTARIMGLDDPSKKMSKSAQSTGNYIGLLDSPDEIRKKIKRAVTDSETNPEFHANKQPGIANLQKIYAAFRELTVTDAAKKTWKDYNSLKNDVSEAVIEKLEPIQKKHQELAKNPDKLKKILDAGAQEARVVAEKTLNDVKEKMGLI